MKSPKLADIPAATPETSFTERAKVAKTIAKKQDTQKAGVKITFSLHPDHAAYINKLALKLGQKRGKNVSASESLRTIIDEHRGQA